MKSVDLEIERGDYIRAREILMMSKNEFPDSVELWMRLVDIAVKKNHIFSQAQELLKQAVDHNPYSVELWLRFANFKIEQGNHIQAREILKKGIDHRLDSVELWMKLAWIEYENNAQRHETIEKALIFFADNDFEIKPVEWIRAAKETDSIRSNGLDRFSPLKSHTFLEVTVPSIIPMFSDENELNVNCRRVLNFSERKFNLLKVRTYPTNKRFWVQAVQANLSEKFYGAEDLEELLELACKNCPHDMSLRNLIQGMMHLRNNYKSHAGRFFNKVNDDYKRKLSTNIKYMDEIVKVQKELKSIQQIDLSDVNPERKLRFKIGRYDQRSLRYTLEDIWLAGDHEFVRKSLERLILIFPDDVALWDMKAQTEIENGELNQAAQTYNNAINICPENTKDYFVLIIRLSELEHGRGNSLTAIHILESANLKFPDNVQLSIAFIRLELQINEKTKAQSLLTQAMLKFPKSGELWAQAILMEERCKRGAKVAEALKMCGDDKDVMLAAAKMFFTKGEVEKSRKWLNKTVRRYSMFADAWIYLYKIEKLFGTEESARKVLFQFIQSRSNLSPFHSQYNQLKIGVYVKGVEGEKLKEWINFKDKIDHWGLVDEELLEVIVKKDIAVLLDNFLM